MYKQLVIGYDCREMQFTGSLSPLSETAFLRQAIKKLLTVDRTLWSLIFLAPIYINGVRRGTVPDHHLEIPVEHGTSIGFWDNLDAMRIFLNKHESEYQKPCWMIAITVAQTPNYVDKLRSENGNFALVPLSQGIQPQSGEQEWLFLGYDVEDEAMSEGLSIAAYSEAQQSLQQHWGKHLNDYHLFIDQEKAIEFADWQAKAENHPYFVYGLYLIERLEKE